MGGIDPLETKRRTENRKMSVKTINKMSSELGIGYADFDDVPRGRHCIAFVRLSESRGLKVYNERDDRDRLYLLQRSLESKGMAPGCDGCIDLVMEDGSTKYAYVTIIADVAYDGYKGTECRTDYADSRNLTRSQVLADCNDLANRLGRIGYMWRDCCIFNFGYINGRAVLIDVDQN